MREFIIKTEKEKEIVDITDIVNAELSKEGLKDGLCYLFLKHTTAALMTADLDPGTDLDMLDAFQEMIPAHGSKARNKEGIIKYRHLHDPSHVPDHILSALIGTSVLVPMKNSQLILGTWQRVILAEFKGPRQREVIMHILATST